MSFTGTLLKDFLDLDSRSFQTDAVANKLS